MFSVSVKNKKWRQAGGTDGGLNRVHARELEGIEDGGQSACGLRNHMEGAMQFNSQTPDGFGERLAMGTGGRGGQSGQKIERNDRQGVMESTHRNLMDVARSGWSA